MHPARRQNQDVRAKWKSLQKENVYLDSREEAEPVCKRARLDSEIQTPSFTESDGQLGTSSSARTPFRINDSGWIKLDTPSPNLAAEAPQRHILPLCTQQQEHLPFSGCDSANESGASANELGARQRGSSLVNGKFEEVFLLSPAALTSSPHDFSTEEVRKELSRLQAGLQQLPSSDQAAETLALDQSCRQLEWSDASPAAYNCQKILQDSRALHVTPTDPLSATQQSLEANATSNIEHGNQAPFQLAPGFALAADIKAVERQQREKPRSKLKRRLSEWDIPPRVAAVSFLILPFRNFNSGAVRYCESPAKFSESKD